MLSTHLFKFLEQLDKTLKISCVSYPSSFSTSFFVLFCFFPASTGV
jgi:hypothetical protein